MSLLLKLVLFLSVINLLFALFKKEKSILRDKHLRHKNNKNSIEFKGMTFVGDKYCPEVNYTSSLALDSITNIASTGTEWIAVVVTEYQDFTNSTEIYPLINRTKHNNYFTYKTESPEGIRNVVNYAHSIGLKVMLKPHIDLTEEKDPLVWRGNIGQDFSSEQQWLNWFASYEKYIVKYAKLAEELKVEMFSMSCELIAVSKRDDLWRPVVKSVRQVYSGIVTDSANHDGEEFEKKWWDVLDYIGVDAYYLDIKTKDHAHNLTSVEEQLTAVAEKLKVLSNKWNKQIIITEVGFCSGNCERNVQSQLYEQYMQADFYNKFMKVFNRYDFIRGYFWWAWNTDPNFGSLEETCISPQHKFAQLVVQEYYDDGVRSLPLPLPISGKAKCICTI